MSHADTNLTSTASIQEKFKSWQLASKNKINMKQMKRGNARPFLCTYSSACPPPHPWVDQGSDLAPTCSPCLSPHQLTATPLISFPLSDTVPPKGKLSYEPVFRFRSCLISHTRNSNSDIVIGITTFDYCIKARLEPAPRLPAKSPH